MTDPRRTFVLVHGAWHGGWCWKETRAVLEETGHRVFTPTQTGLGERSHLLSREITLDTFVNDIANVLRFEALEEVVLVGHSFGGLAISGVADRMPERLRQLIYLDSMIMENGYCPFDTLTPEVVEGRIRASEESSGGLSLPFPKPKSLGILNESDAAKLGNRLTPHPVSTYHSPLHLKHPLTNGVPATYVVCTDPIYTPLETSRQLARTRGIPFIELATGHDAMITAPDALAHLFMKIAG